MIVIQRLKEYREHSGPFINKVKQSDAPGYYKIITKPMYLNLIQQKLSKREYKNKSEFQSDLDQIWENCRTFNTDQVFPFKIFQFFKIFITFFF